MSEYQYYELQAIDRPLTAREMEALRRLSSRATITQGSGSTRPFTDTAGIARHSRRAHPGPGNEPAMVGSGRCARRARGGGSTPERASAGIPRTRARAVRS